jgi:hypothetical protein
VGYPARYKPELPMFAIQLISIAFLFAAAFTFASYILINDLLIEWNAGF